MDGGGGAGAGTGSGGGGGGVGSGGGSGGGGVAAIENLLVGSVVTLRLESGDVINGLILSYDRPLRLLVINRFYRDGAREGEDKPGNRYDIRILKYDYIKQVVYRHREANNLLDPKKSVIDIPAILEREETALRKAEEQAKRIGDGVTIEAQYIFDTLSKTYDVKWDKTDMVVMNELRICSPYLPENVHGGTPAANERIKKVIKLVKLAVEEIFSPDK